MRWPELRAGLIAIAIFFGLVDGCPIPPAGDTPEWSRAAVEPVRKVQHVVLAPVAWIGFKLRIAQRWALYQAPRADRYRLQIEGQTADGRWQVVFRVGDADHAEDEALIMAARVRGAWDPVRKPPAQYAPFANWYTTRLLARHAEFVAARVRMERIRISSDGIVSSGKYEYTYQHDRNGP